MPASRRGAGSGSKRSGGGRGGSDTSDLAKLVAECQNEYKDTRPSGGGFPLPEGDYAGTIFRFDETPAKAPKSGDAIIKFGLHVRCTEEGEYDDKVCIQTESTMQLEGRDGDKWRPGLRVQKNNAMVLNHGDEIEDFAESLACIREACEGDGTDVTFRVKKRGGDSNWHDLILLELNKDVGENGAPVQS